MFGTTLITFNASINVKVMGEGQESTTVAVAETVSDAIKTPIEDLPPLTESIDIDALDGVIPNDQSQDVTVAFTYADVYVFVHSGNVVAVKPIQGEFD